MSGIMDSAPTCGDYLNDLINLKIIVDSHGQFVEFKISSSIQIRCARYHIDVYVNIHRGWNYKLKYSDQHLDETKTFDDYNIKNNDVIYLDIKKLTCYICHKTDDNIENMSCLCNNLCSKCLINIMFGNPFCPTCNKLLTTNKRIFVKPFEREPIMINIMESNTIDYLKYHIERVTNIPHYQLRLIYNGYQLADANTLEYYKIQHKDTLHLVLSRGGD
jgi:thiol-disulfide isomerase/thioredoxin